MSTLRIDSLGMGPRTDRLVEGACAGFAATLPMSAVMLALDRGRPGGDVRPLPPRQITLEAADQAGVRQQLDEPTRSVLTVVNHFGYGTAMGAVFGALCSTDQRPSAATTGSLVARGIGFGLAVWGGSYLGWLPAVGSRAAASRQSDYRNGLMIAAHVVWGASLGYLLAQRRRAVWEQSGWRAEGPDPDDPRHGRGQTGADRSRSAAPKPPLLSADEARREEARACERWRNESPAAAANAAPNPASPTTTSTPAPFPSPLPLQSSPLPLPQLVPPAADIAAVPVAPGPSALPGHESSHTLLPRDREVAHAEAPR